jgi:hypothetical protein
MIVAKKAPQYIDIEKSRTAYERASQALPKLKENLIEPFKNKLYGASGIDPYSMNLDVIQKQIPVGDVTFDFQIERRIKNPAYKSIVEGWSGYVKGLNLLTTERTITGVIKREGINYVSAESLRDQFAVRAYGALDVGLEFNMLNPEKMLKQKGISKLEEIVIPESHMDVRLETQFANAYWNAIQLVDGMERLVETYTREIRKAEKLQGARGLKVTKKKEYATEAVYPERANWAGVVKTLIQMPTDKDNKDNEDKELDILADERLSIKERIEEFGDFYNLVKHNPYGEQKLYVGLGSVAGRIQELKCEKTSSERLTTKAREVL